MKKFDEWMMESFFNAVLGLLCGLVLLFAFLVSVVATNGLTLVLPFIYVGYSYWRFKNGK
jgi:hypothetical protein